MKDLHLMTDQMIIDYLKMEMFDIDLEFQRRMYRMLDELYDEGYEAGVEEATDDCDCIDDEDAVYNNGYDSGIDVGREQGAEALEALIGKYTYDVEDVLNEYRRIV